MGGRANFLAQSRVPARKRSNTRPIAAFSSPPLNDMDAHKEAWKGIGLHSLTASYPVRPAPSKNQDAAKEALLKNP